MSVHVEARVDVRMETRQSRRRKQKEKQPVVTTLHYYGTHWRHREVHSDVDVKHDHHPQPATRGAQPHAKRADPRAGIMEVAIGKTFQAFHG